MRRFSSLCWLPSSSCSWRSHQRRRSWCSRSSAWPHRWVSSFFWGDVMVFFNSLLDNLLCFKVEHENSQLMCWTGFSAGLRQPWPAWQRIHLLAPVVHWPRDCQGGGVVRKAPDLRGDGPDRTHPAGRAHLPHWFPGVCLPQTAQRVCRGQPRNPPETPSCAAQQVRHCSCGYSHSSEGGEFEFQLDSAGNKLFKMILAASTQVRAQWAEGQRLPWTSLTWSPARVTCWVTCWTWTWALRSTCHRSPPCRWGPWTFWVEAWTVWWVQTFSHTSVGSTRLETLSFPCCIASVLRHPLHI